MTVTTSRSRRLMLVLAGSAALAWCPWPATTSATPELFSEAVKQGLPAQNCQFCHVSQMPQKGSYTPADLNERGKWLMTTKDKQQAKDVKAEWLKQYPGGPAPK
jgi:hypothetical protein